MMTQSKNKSRTQRTSVLLLALAAFTTSVTFTGVDIAMSEAARAAEPAVYPTQTVRIGSLDLATERDVAKLNRRIARAARNVCLRSTTSLLPRAREQRACVMATKRNAMVQAHRKVALYRSKRLATD